MTPTTSSVAPHDLDLPGRRGLLSRGDRTSGSVMSGEGRLPGRPAGHPRRVGPPRGVAAFRRTVIVALALAATNACGSSEAPREVQPTGSGTSESVTPLEDVLVARVELVGDPDWLASDERGVWVQRSSGEVTVIDTGTNEPTSSADLGDTQLCAGLGASFGSIWTCMGPDVIRVDPQTFEVQERLKLKKQAVQGHLVGGFGRVWVLTGDGSALVGIDPTTNDVSTRFELPARCSDVSLADDALWLPCRIDDRVLKIDPDSGEPLLDLAVDNPVSIAADDEVWVGTATTTLRVDPATGAVITEVDAPADGGLALDAESVWVRSLEEFLVRVDRETGQRVQQIEASDLTSVGDLMTLDGEVWTTAHDDQVLFRIDAGTDS